ncbi:MAG: GGDEF domain-containing protein [Armatimonadota bacterium]|nr:GGDEF domain-containing protein [bacterium]MDW8321684.1 GGDEF domain-containing protein [Armatimonadota bacterium]
MQRLKDMIHSPPVWVNPQHPVKVAIALMQSFQVDVLPVREGDQVVGMVTARQLLAVAEETPVSEVMSTTVLLLSAETPIREAADHMAKAGVEVAFVINDTLAGMVRAIDLVPEVSRSYDPLTRLPWQDALREWSIEKLRTGHEISILFFDIDSFGQFNKQYDHVTGDRVLEVVARTIERELDPDLAILCRYGGDEFAVATLYMIDEAQQLAARIARRVEEIQLPKVRDIISVSYGVFGGRRTREREMVHYAATVDDLIVRASRLCLQMKQRKGTLAMLQLPLPGVEPEERAEPRVQVKGISYIVQGKDAEASVELAIGNARAVRQARGDAKQPPEELMVRAARDALVALLPNIGAIQIYHVSKVAIDLLEKGEKMDGIMVVVETQTAAGNQLFSGFAPVRENAQRAAVNALLHALNRPLAKWLSPSQINSST